MLFAKSLIKRRPREWLMVMLLASPMSAIATPITGAIGFGGMYTPTGGTGLDLGDATGLNEGFASVTAASGDYLPALGSGAVFNAVVFSPTNTPIVPLWTVDKGTIIYSFSLLALSVDFQDPDQINLTGSGVVSATGFEDTPGQWTFSGNQSSIFYTFSSITQSTPVPAPATLLLLVAGVAVIGLSRRRYG